MILRRTALLFATLATSILVGCRAELPTFPAMSDEDALRTIAARQASISSISGECELVLTRADGQSVHLDGVLVAEPPDKARLKAWKFGHSVFDLTLLGDHAWLLLSPHDSDAPKSGTSEVPTRQVKEALDLLGPTYFVNALPAGSGPSLLTVRGRAFGHQDVVCEIERRTLTPVRFVVPGEPGGASAELTLDKYALVNNIPWAYSMRMRGPGGEIIIRFDGVELNGEIPPGAFAAPQGAILLP